MVSTITVSCTASHTCKIKVTTLSQPYWLGNVSVTTTEVEYFSPSQVNVSPAQMCLFTTVTGSTLCTCQCLIITSGQPCALVPVVVSAVSLYSNTPFSATLPGHTVSYKWIVSLPHIVRSSTWYALSQSAFDFTVSAYIPVLWYVRPVTGQ